MSTFSMSLGEIYPKVVGLILVQRSNWFLINFRSFTNDELKGTFESKGFKKFLNKAESLFTNVQEEGDIMGDFKEDVHSFYMRDFVEEKIETRLIEHLSLSDLVFSRNKRVKDVRWHPRQRILDH